MPMVLTVLTVNVQQQISAKLKTPEPSAAAYSNGGDFASVAPDDDSGFESSRLRTNGQAALGKEDSFKVVGYIYPQGRRSLRVKVKI